MSSTNLLLSTASARGPAPGELTQQPQSTATEAAPGFSDVLREVQVEVQVKDAEFAAVLSAVVLAVAETAPGQVLAEGGKSLPQEIATVNVTEVSKLTPVLSGQEGREHQIATVNAVEVSSLRPVLSEEEGGEHQIATMMTAMPLTPEGGHLQGKPSLATSSLVGLAGQQPVHGEALVPKPGHVEAMASVDTPNGPTMLVPDPVLGDTKPGPLTPQSFSVPTPIQAPDWGASFAKRVLWMVKGDVQIAELRLNPPDLGQVEVRIALSNTDANITFGAQQPLVRDAIEAAMPRLREMLGESGVNLVNVDVSQHSFTGGEHARSGDSQILSNDEETFAEDGPTEAVEQLHEGLIDRYA